MSLLSSAAPVNLESLQMPWGRSQSFTTDLDSGIALPGLSELKDRLGLSRIAEKAAEKEAMTRERRNLYVVAAARDLFPDSGKYTLYGAKNVEATESTPTTISAQESNCIVVGNGATPEVVEVGLHHTWIPGIFKLNVDCLIGPFPKSSSEYYRKTAFDKLLDKQIKNPRYRWNGLEQFREAGDRFPAIDLVRASSVELAVRFRSVLEAFVSHYGSELEDQAVMLAVVNPLKYMEDLSADRVVKLNSVKKTEHMKLVETVTLLAFHLSRHAEKTLTKALDKDSEHVCAVLSDSHQKKDLYFPELIKRLGLVIEENQLSSRSGAELKERIKAVWEREPDPGLRRFKQAVLTGGILEYLAAVQADLEEDTSARPRRKSRRFKNQR